MFKVKIKKAFTLIELLVWISIITMIIMWATSIDYNRLSQKQKLEIFTNNIKANFETIRNSSLSWKWIWLDLDIPKKWKIEYSKTNSWVIQSSTYNWDVWSSNNNLQFPIWFYISKINCLTINWAIIYENISWTWTIEFTWSNMILTWETWECPSNRSKILEIYITHTVNTKKITFNVLNWLVEIK